MIAQIIGEILALAGLIYVAVLAATTPVGDNRETYNDLRK